MKPLIPSLPFLAFPSEKIFADFRPVRGLLIETPAPQDGHDRPLREFRSLRDLTDLHDPRPLIESIAREMGYDADLLAAGEGETGVAGHSWTAYCGETWLPMLVRWQAGDAQLLLTFVETHDRGPAIGSDLRLTILGDMAALPILRRLTVALKSFHPSKPNHAQGQVEIDGRPRTLTLPEIAFARFSATASVWASEAGEIGADRITELADIARSCNLSTGRIDAEAPITADTLQVMLHAGQQWAMTCRQGQPLPRELVEYIQRQSVGEVRRMTTSDLWAHFGPPQGLLQPNSLLFGVEQQNPAVIAQRLHPAGILHEVEQLPVRENHRLFSRPFGTFRLALGHTSIGPEFRKPDDEVLAGTEHRAYGRDGATGYDLLSVGIMAVEFAMKFLDETLRAEERRNPPKQGWPIPHLGELRLGPGAPRVRLMAAAKPTYGIHLGLPVRIDLSAVVWWADDAQALAIDFHHSAAGTHLARLRRCPIPVKKA
jgi:hypothetical protein